MKIMIVFQCLLEPQKIDFWTSMAQHGPILAPKMAPSWLQNGVKTDPKTVSEAMSAPEPILGRLWVDFLSILGRRWVEFGRFWDDFW